MALEIFKLVGSIYVDNDKANESIAKTDEKASNLGEKFSNGIKTAGKWGAAIASGAAVAVGGAVNLAKKTADAADNVDKMSQKLGLSREAYQEWDYVLSQNGMSIDSMTSGVKTLTDTFADATAGNEKAIEKFEALGLSMEDIADLDREELFDATIAALQGMEDNADRAALANDLLGKSASNLTPLFNQTAESTNNLKGKAHELGLVMSDEAIDSGVKMKDTFDTLQRTFEALVVSLGTTLLPLIQQLADVIIANMPAIQGMVEKISPVLMSLIDALLPIVIDLVEEILPILLDLIESLLPVVESLCVGILPILVDLIKILLPPLIQIIEMLLPTLNVLLTALGPVLEPLLQLLAPILELLIAILTPLLQIIEVILPILTEYLSLLTTFLSGALTVAISAIVKIINETVLPIFTAISEKIKLLQVDLQFARDNVISIFNTAKDRISQTIDVLKQKFKEGFENIKQSVKTPVNAIIGFINKLITGLNNIKIDIPSWIPGDYGGKSFGIEIPTIPKLAKGGVIDNSGTVLVGERGPELLNLPQGASVHPLNGDSAFDYEQMQKAFTVALQTIIPYLDKQIVPDPDGMFKVMKRKSDEYYNMTGGMVNV